MTINEGSLVNRMDDKFVGDCRTCSSKNLPNKVLLADILPTNYDHHICKFQQNDDIDGRGSYEVTFRLELSTENEAKKWLEDFQESSFTTFRLAHTYPNIAEKNGKIEYKVDLRCQHNTLQRASRAKDRNGNKHTDCKAKMNMSIVKLKDTCTNESRKRIRRTTDPHLPDKRLVVTLYHTHNHPIIAADALRHRDVSNDVKDKLIGLYKNGYTPSKALELHKYDLQVEYGDNYLLKSGDRAICPDLGYCYRLYYKNVSATTVDVAEPSRPLDSLHLQRDLQNDLLCCNHLPDNQHQQLDPDDGDDLIQELKSVFETFKSSYRDNRDYFEKPMRTFIDQAKSLKTNSALESALQCFGKYSEVATTLGNRRKGKQFTGFEEK